MASTIDPTLRGLPNLEPFERSAARRATSPGAAPFPDIEAEPGPAADAGRAAAPQGAGAASGSFADLLADAVQQARALGAEADGAAQSLARGEGGIHETMIAAEKASIATRFAITMKNRALEAYKEILQTQI